MRGLRNVLTPLFLGASLVEAASTSGFSCLLFSATGSTRRRRKGVRNLRPFLGASPSVARGTTGMSNS